jgi:hypothetical protein
MNEEQINQLAEKVSKAYRDRDYNLGTFLVKHLNKDNKYKVTMKANEINAEIRAANKF